MEETNRIIEVNGIKMEIDLRNAKRIDEFKVGDYVKVLVKGYSNYESYIGNIIGFDNYKETPTIVIAYLETSYSSAAIKFLYYNSKTTDAEITSLNSWDIPLTKSQMIDSFNKERDKKELELKEITQKQEMFEKLFGKYFEDKVYS